LTRGPVRLPRRIALNGRLLDLHNTLFSGQNFRWREDGDWYSGVVAGNVVRVRLDAETLEFTSFPDAEAEVEPLLLDYLALDFDLDHVYESISHDLHIQPAIEKYAGMRVLRQDPWETMLSFLCAQASNVPRITKNVEDMCEVFGAEIGVGDMSRHAYPTPGALAEAGEGRLKELGLGYRAKFIASTAQAIADGDVDLLLLREAPYEDALASLVTLDGIGDKVANCILLFSLDKPEAFPVDTWIQKTVQQLYMGRKKVGLKAMRLWAQDYFKPYAGYANHYLFHSRRLEAKSRRVES